MGLEFLFSPITVLIFIAVNLVAVLSMRLLCPSAFEALGLKKVATGYACVLVLSLLLGIWSGDGTLRGAASHFLLVSYLSLLFVLVGLLPASLWLASRGKFSVGALILVGAFVWALLAICLVLTDGFERIIERGSGGLLMQASILGFLAAVSVIFALGLKKR
jgi:hypothetical protein